MAIQAVLCDLGGVVIRIDPDRIRDGWPPATHRRDRPDRDGLGWKHERFRERTAS